MKEKISLLELKEILYYNPETGKFIWKIRRNSYAGKIKPGVEAGTPISNNRSKKGYISIIIDKIKYKAHRLAWFYMTGEWPKDEIDHIDRDTLNNKWENLREASRSQNSANMIKAVGESGLKGAYYNKRTGQWFSQISVNSKSKYLGTFSNKEECAKVYQQACKYYYGEFGIPE